MYLLLTVQQMFNQECFCVLFSRLINPVVVAPTIAAVGLSFYSYGFPLVGTCIEIGIIQILLVIIFSLVSNYCSISYFSNLIHLLK